MGKRRQFWDCSYCGMKGIKRKEKTCPNCQSPRPHKTKFYQPEIILDIADERRWDPNYDGSDWTCGYCGAGNPNTANHCSACRAPRETGPEFQIAQISLKKEPGKKKKPVGMYDRYRKHKQRRAGKAGRAAEAAAGVRADDSDRVEKPSPGISVALKIAGVLGVLLFTALALVGLYLLLS